MNIDSVAVDRTRSLLLLIRTFSMAYRLPTLYLYRLRILLS